MEEAYDDCKPKKLILLVCKDLDILYGLQETNTIGLVNIDWLKLRGFYETRGVPMSGRDADSILQTWDSNSQLLTNLGITDRFKFLFITKEWILNKGLSKQVEDQQARENPNAVDLLNKEWKQAYPGGFETPQIPIFDIDWFRSKKKK